MCESDYFMGKICIFCLSSIKWSKTASITLSSILKLHCSFIYSCVDVEIIAFLLYLYYFTNFFFMEKKFTSMLSGSSIM